MTLSSAFAAMLKSPKIMVGMVRGTISGLVPTMITMAYSGHFRRLDKKDANIVTITTNVSAMHSMEGEKKKWRGKKGTRCGGQAAPKIKLFLGAQGWNYKHIHMTIL